MIDKERTVEEFLRLTGFDAESNSEGEIASYLRERLLSLGLAVSADDAGNLYAFLEGTAPGEERLFSAHMDTVSPGKGKRAAVGPDGVIRSDGTTVLGADDLAGVVSILEALTVIREQGLPHPPLEILFTAAEEFYCRGSAAFDFEKIRSGTAYVMDMSGPVGSAAIAAPSILSVDVTVRGRAAHAGFAPEAGTNALSAAARALAALDTGRVAPDTTVNFGLISGGSGKNIVPAEIRISGEVRSLRHDAALDQADAIRRCFRTETEAMDAAAEVQVTEELRAYRIAEDALPVRRLQRALSDLALGPARLVTTFGGSDNNRFALHGISGVVLSCGMENVHTVRECLPVDQLCAAAELALRLMTMEED